MSHYTSEPGLKEWNNYTSCGQKDQFLGPLRASLSLRFLAKNAGFMTFLAQLNFSNGDESNQMFNPKEEEIVSKKAIFSHLKNEVLVGI